MFSLVQRVGTFGSQNDAVLSREDGTPEMAAPISSGRPTKVVNAWKSSSWLSSLHKANCPCWFCHRRLILPFPVLFQLLPCFSSCSWGCSEFATSSLISKAMVNPSLKSFKLSANNPLLKLLARKLGWAGARLTTPRFYFCFRVISSWSHFWPALETPPTIAVE